MVGKHYSFLFFCNTLLVIIVVKMESFYYSVVTHFNIFAQLLKNTEFLIKSDLYTVIMCVFSIIIYINYVL